MKKLICLTLPVFFTLIFYAQEESFYAEVDSNYATLWHINTSRDCDATHEMLIYIDENKIDWYQNYFDGYADCYCFFDLSVTVGELKEGQYNANVYSIWGQSDTLFHGTIEFEIVTNQTPDSTYIIEQYQSPCNTVTVNESNIKTEFNTHPNPFKTSATIEYDLIHPQTITITFYNQFGKQVDLIQQKQSAGKQRLVWNSEGLPAGIYFCVLKTESGTQTLKMIKLK